MDKLKEWIASLIPLISLLLAGVWFAAKIETRLTALEANQEEAAKIFESYVSTQARTDDKQTQLFFSYQKIMLKKLLDDSKCRD